LSLPRRRDAGQPRGGRRCSRYCIAQTRSESCALSSASRRARKFRRGRANGGAPEVVQYAAWTSRSHAGAEPKLLEQRARRKRGGASAPLVSICSASATGLRPAYLSAMPGRDPGDRACWPDLVDDARKRSRDGFQTGRRHPLWLVVVGVLGTSAIRSVTA